MKLITFRCCFLTYLLTVPPAEIAQGSYFLKILILPVRRSNFLQMTNNIASLLIAFTFLVGKMRSRLLRFISPHCYQRRFLSEPFGWIDSTSYWRGSSCC